MVTIAMKIKRRLLLGRKVMIKLDSILKSRDITLPTKVHLVKAMVFPVVMYGCESWTIKKTEHQIIDAFELWYWRRLLRVPWTARRSNQSILKEISPGCSLEGLMLKLKLQYFGHLMRRADSLEKTLMLGNVSFYPLFLSSHECLPGAVILLIAVVTLVVFVISRGPQLIFLFLLWIIFSCCSIP